MAPAGEQAASCQKVLGGWANIANEYATKRYRSNLINWGMLPFLIEEGELPFTNLDYLFIPGIRKAVEEEQGHHYRICGEGRQAEVLYPHIRRFNKGRAPDYSGRLPHKLQQSIKKQTGRIPEKDAALFAQKDTWQNASSFVPSPAFE